MPEDLRPDEAARALTEIRQRQEQVIKLATIPAWYWWAIAGLMVGFTAAIDSHRPLAIGIGTSLFVIGVVTATVRVVIGGMRRAQPRNDLLGTIGVLAILASSQRSWPCHCRPRSRSRPPGCAIRPRSAYSWVPSSWSSADRC
jgi:hypothetical protein